MYTCSSTSRTEFLSHVPGGEDGSPPKCGGLQVNHTTATDCGRLRVVHREERKRGRYLEGALTPTLLSSSPSPSPPPPPSPLLSSTPHRGL